MAMRQSRLLEHPRGTPCPGQRRQRTGLQIEPPSRWGSNDSWHHFRRELEALLQHHRDDPTLQHYIAAADQVIAWRDTVPPQDRFWATDRP